MEYLMNPDTGLMVWTVVVFALLVMTVGRFAWKPLLKALADREASIRRAIADAESARKSAEELKVQYEQGLVEAQAKAQATLAQALKDAQLIRDRMLSEAQSEAQRLADQSKKQLEEEKARLVRELRQEVVNLSVRAAEKLIQHSMTPQVQSEILGKFFKELDQAPRETSV